MIQFLQVIGLGVIDRIGGCNGRSVSLLVLVIGLARAQQARSAGTPQQCAEIENDIQRLECYDAVAQAEGNADANSVREALPRGFQEAFDQVVEENAANDAEFKRVNESYQRFREDYAERAKLSQLPADLEAD